MRNRECRSWTFFEEECENRLGLAGNFMNLICVSHSLKKPTLNSFDAGNKIGMKPDTESKVALHVSLLAANQKKGFSVAYYRY